MAVQKTDCYKVVNIGYLKSLIGSNIQNNNGEVVNVNTTQPDTYCPTYSELTGGTLIPNWSQGSTPRSDRDGITVNSTAVLGGTYKTNQLVDRKDLGVKYTRFNTLTISRSGSGNISECGGNATLSKTYNYTRYTTSMNNSCVTSTTSSVVDGACNELTYHTLTGSVTNCTNYSIGKNGSISSTTRTDKISATTTFRGATKASGVVNITQNGLSGEYSVYDGRTYTGLTVSPIGTKGTQSNPIGCEGGVFGVTAMAYYKDKYHWKDSCGTEYTSKIKETSGQETLANTATTKMVVGDASLVCEGNSQFTYSSITGRATDKFDAINCCSGGENKNKTLSVTYQGQTASQTFYQVCADCSSSDKCKQPITEKFVTLTLSNGNVIDVEGSGTLTQNIMSPYKNTVVKAEIGTLCTSIGIAAFKECSNLESVSVSSTVSSISPYIFGYCNKLTKVTVDSGNATYDSRNNCNGIITKGTNIMVAGCKTTVIPNNVVKIDEGAFWAIESLLSITIPNSVTATSESSFSRCYNLTAVTMSSNLKVIGQSSFRWCAFTSVTIPNSVTTIEQQAFQQSGLVDIVVPDNVTTINVATYEECTNATAVTIHSNVDNIYIRAFSGCSNLTKITVEATYPPTLLTHSEYPSDGINTVFGNTNNCPIYVPCESVNTYKTSWSPYADRITCNSTDCSVHNWLDLGTSVGKESGTAAIANYINSYGDIVWRDKPEWITAITQETGPLPRVTMVKATYEASSVDRRVGRVNFISQSDGCTFSAFLTQENAVAVTVNWYAQRTEWGDGQYGGYYYTTVSDEELPFTLSVTPSLGTTSYGIHECSEQHATSSYVHFKKLRESPADYTDYYAGGGKIFCSHTIIMLTTTVSGDTMIIRNGVNVTINGIVYNFTWTDVN